MLKRLEIKCFKRIESLTFDTPRKMSVLLGGNDSGKSSALEAIHFAISAAQAARALNEEGWVTADEFRHELGPEHLSFSRLDWRSVFRGENAVCVGFEAEEGRCEVRVSRKTPYSLEVVVSGRLVGEQIQDLRRPFCVYVPGLAGVPLSERWQSAGAIRRSIARGDSNLVLRNVLYQLKEQAASWPVFLSDLREIFPQVELAINSDVKRDELIEVMHKTDGPALPLASAGTGFLQCAQLLAYTHLYSPRVLLLDEPDSHLHAGNQQRLCSLLQRLCDQFGLQVLMATHSRHLTSALVSQADFYWLKGGSAVPDAGPGLIAALMDLGALDEGDQWIGQTLKCVVLTEDTDRDLLKNVLWGSGFHEKETIVVSYGGCKNLLALDAFKSFMQHRAKDVNLVVHRDRDFMEDTEESVFNKDMSERGFIPFLTEGNDVEAYYLNAEYISKEFGLTLEKAQALINKAISTTDDKSLEKMVNTRCFAAYAARKKDSPNAAAIAFGAKKQFEALPSRYRHGKTVMNAVRALLQNEIKKPVSDKLPRSDSTLRADRLTKIAEMIWPLGAQAAPQAPPGQAAPAAHQPGVSKQPEGAPGQEAGGTPTG